MKIHLNQLSARQIWGMPLFLACLSALGLISALMGDGMWDMLSWIALAAPLGVVVWHLTHSQRAR
jgi:hypothetical protein